MSKIPNIFSNGQQFSSQFLIDVAKGLVKGHTVMHKFAENPEIGLGQTEDLWDFGGDYTWSAGVDITHISSGHADDDQDVQVLGLGADWSIVDQTATLDGQNKVELDTPLRRAFRMQNRGTTDLQGVVYCYEDDTVTAGVPDTDSKVRAVIVVGNNKTLMSMFTVPADVTGFCLQFRVGITRGGGATGISRGVTKVRPFEGVFTTEDIFNMNSAGTSTVVAPFLIPLAIPQKSDLKVRVDSNANGVAIGGTYDLLLIENEYLPAEFLARFEN